MTGRPLRPLTTAGAGKPGMVPVNPVLAQTGQERMSNE